MNGRELLEQWAFAGHPLAIQALDLPHSDEIDLSGSSDGGVLRIYPATTARDEFYVEIGEMERDTVEIIWDGPMNTALIMRTSDVAVAVKTMLELNATIKAVAA